MKLTLQATNVINVLILVLKLVAILHVASTLAIICGIAVLLRAQNPGMEAKVGLIFAWAGTGAALTIELAVRMLHGQAMMLKQLTALILKILKISRLVHSFKNHHAAGKHISFKATWRHVCGQCWPALARLLTNCNGLPIPNYMTKKL